ncbi:hypothetical protein [Polaribacter aestuariivivens]|uniref:hypothetical protein n=1 Tax=Polaribacter aestuariivivens TaxID=2304626 RepID=UPI001FEAE0FB|nr:hypothetical protein [Polaribacter aestuariivivens]
MKFYKTISVILHPIVIPTIGVILYFLLIPNYLNSKQKLILLSLIFTITYVIPLFVLILFKKLKLIKSFNVNSIKERKVPIAIMIVLFYLLGNTLFRVTPLDDLGLLFYATCGALVFIYLLFAFSLKTSIHLASMGITTGFFLIIGAKYNHSFPIIVIASILLSGILANARLHLKAHTTTEVYLGYFIGFLSPFITFYFL